jgi:hypothetical protein
MSGRENWSDWETEYGQEIYYNYGDIFILSRTINEYVMSKTTDERGRIYLPKDVRERFGDQYRIVELPSHVALFPVDEDPLEGLRAAVGDAFAETDVHNKARLQ